MRGMVARFAALILGGNVVAYAEDARDYDQRPAGAQSLELFYAHTRSNTASDKLVPLVNIDATFDTVYLNYRDYFSLAGQSAFVAASVPEVELKAKDDDDPFGDTRQTGAGDPMLMLANSVYGRASCCFDADEIPAALAWSLALTLPLGAYDASQSVNAGNNRWVVRPQFNWSRGWRGLHVDTMAAVSWFGANPDYQNGETLRQRLLTEWEAHLSGDIYPGIWWAVQLVYSKGGRATVAGKWIAPESDDWRAGVGLHYESGSGTVLAVLFERDIFTDEQRPNIRIGKFSYATRW